LTNNTVSFLRFEIHICPNAGGVGEGRKAAAKPWSFGGGHQCLTPITRSMIRLRLFIALFQKLYVAQCQSFPIGIPKCYNRGDAPWLT
jgi:hypothetical protein